MEVNFKEKLACRQESQLPFDKVVNNLQEQSAANQFRVLAVHDVQKTLAEKSLERGPLTIIEVCNAGFAHQALQQAIEVSLFMPCKFSVYTENGKTVVLLARPSMISTMLPEAGLEKLAGEVEDRLKKVMEAAI